MSPIGKNLVIGKRFIKSLYGQQRSDPRLLWKIIVEMRSLAEKYLDSQLVSNIMNSISRNFITITYAVELFQDLETIALEEIIGTLKIWEDKLKDH